jgi:glycosyltransferase involved in cell wall biosynthesis
MSQLRLDMPVTKTPKFSFLLPTRGNLEGINCFFQSIVDTTDRLDELEIVLAVDDDDLESQAITHKSLTIKRVVLPHGTTMGNLNRACFDLSSGRYVMLINDDIIIRTKGWDTLIAGVLAGYPDDIALIHVNDLLFRERLCTFPVLSRRACLEIGVCPAEYRRYRIDDHIYDTYSLLAYLGHSRIIYLPDVVFEHQNHAAKPEATGGHIFKSVDNKVYTPNQAIIELDARQFDATLETRKRDAIRLAQLIAESYGASQKVDFTQRGLGSRTTAYPSLLADVKDSYSYRRDEFVRHYATAASPARTTVAVVTSDLRTEYAAKCISLIKEHTRNYDLVILDNGRRPNFRHTHEMNKIMLMAETDYLVLMDDDVFVEPGWLERLLRCMDNRTALVAPLHRDRRGALSFSGAYFAGDGLGTHAHLLDRPERPRAAQTVCSALILIDTRKCAGIFMDELYTKYFLDLDFSLQLWEAGYQVVVTPEVTVTHIGGATMAWGSAQANVVQERDRQRFVERWIESGRLARLEQGIWQGYPELRPLVEIPAQINQFFQELAVTDFEERLSVLVSVTGDYPLFRKLLETRLELSLPILQVSGYSQALAHAHATLEAVRAAAQAYDRRPRLPVYRDYVKAFVGTARRDPKLAVRKAWTKLFGPKYADRPVRLVSAYKGFNIIHYRNKYYGLALALGVVNIENISPDRLAQDQQSRLILVGSSVGELKRRLWWDYLRRATALAWKDPRLAFKKLMTKLIGPRDADHVEIVANNYWGYNIVHYRQAYYGLALALGPLEPETIPATALQEYQLKGLVILGNSAWEIKQQIWHGCLMRAMTLARTDLRLALKKALKKLSFRS